MQLHINMVISVLPYLTKDASCPHELVTVSQVVSMLFMTVEQFMTLIRMGNSKTGSLDRALRVKFSALHLRTRRYGSAPLPIAT